MSELKVWRRDPDTVIATSSEDAWEVFLASQGGGTKADYWSETDRPFDDGTWDEVAMSTRIDIHCEDDGTITDYSDNVVLLTAAEWIAREGRGFLCTTER